MVPRGKAKNIPFSALLIFIHIIIIPGFAEPNLKICSPGENYALNSLYEKNLNNLLDVISLNTPKEGYYNNTTGSGAAQVYGQALCRGDVTQQACQDCVANASREVIKQCQGIHIARTLLILTLINFQNLIGKKKKNPKSNEDEKGVTVHPDQYEEQLKQLMDNLANEMYGSKSKFATGKTKFGSTTIYALVQCLRDITESSCKRHVDKALGELYDCCRAHQGGTVFGRSCNVRFTVNKFYRETTNGSVKKRWMVVAITSGSTLAIVVLIGCYYFLCSQQMGRNTDDDSSQNVILHSMSASASFVITEESNIIGSGQDLPFIELAIVKAATENFSDYHKLGQGGFGTVYKMQINVLNLDGLNALT